MIRLLTLAASLALSPAIHAGPGHDHGDAAPPVQANSPQRLPDGSVFLPKASQRQLGVRTVIPQAGKLAQTVTLNGRVVMDPNAGGRVQPTLAGRIEPGSNGLPSLGQAVKRGELLAIVRPSAGQIERGNQAAQLAELASQRDLAIRRAERLSALEGSVPQKDIDAARAEAASLAQRVVAVAGSLRDTERLLAPVTGVIAAANVVAGQVVAPQEVLFEIVDPQRLRIEAAAFDASLATEVEAASLDAGTGRTVPLIFVGAGRALRELALPLQFRTDGKAAVPLATGQPVKVIVQTRGRIEGYPVPAAALVRNPSNETIVWVHTGPEQFMPRVVRFAPLDGATVAVTSGLDAGMRVVVEGAGLVNQVR